MHLASVNPGSNIWTLQAVTLVNNGVSGFKIFRGEDSPTELLDKFLGADTGLTLKKAPPDFMQEVQV